MQSYAGTNYLSPRCRPVSSLGYVEAKNRTAASLTGANKQTIKCTFHLTWRSVCACVWKRAESRGPRADWSTLAFYPKRPARSLCWRLIQTTGKILIWAHIPLNRTASTSGCRFSISCIPQKEHQYTRSLMWWLSIRQPKQYTSSLYPRQSIIACIDLSRYKWFTSSH